MRRFPPPAGACGADERSRTDDGFTLIELLVVVIILGVLAAIAIPSLMRVRTRAQDEAARSDLRVALGAEELYSVDHHAYTHDVAVLSELQPSLVWSGDIGNADMTAGTVYAYQESTAQGAPATMVVLSARSRSGNCFYLRRSSTSTAYRSAGTDECRGPFVNRGAITAAGW